MTENLSSIFSLPYEELKQRLIEWEIEPFRTDQVWHWLYRRGTRSFNDINNIPQTVKDKLVANFTIDRPIVNTAQVSRDGTQKWLLKLSGDQEVETVHIPEVDRGTLCISSQVGCTLSCSFCHTGTQPLVRNLTVEEIVGQVLIARDVFGEWPPPSGKRHISNIVMMGMGEPLYNYENVAKALKIVMDHRGLSLSRRKITLSTSGILPMMKRCGEELGVCLAISLHAVRDDLRDVLVPINKKYPLNDLLQACRTYPGLKNAQRITFEYVMLKNVNDSVAEAKELVHLIRGIPAKINLIPFNPWPGSQYECSSPQAISAFAEVIYKAGYPSPIRTPRGRDILAACGQLKSASERQRKGRRTHNSIETSESFLPAA